MGSTTSFLHTDARLSAEDAASPTAVIRPRGHRLHVRRDLAAQRQGRRPSTFTRAFAPTGTSAVAPAPDSATASGSTPT